MPAHQVLPVAPRNVYRAIRNSVAEPYKFMMFIAASLLVLSAGNSARADPATIVVATEVAKNISELYANLRKPGGNSEEELQQINGELTAIRQDMGRIEGKIDALYPFIEGDFNKSESRAIKAEIDKILASGIVKYGRLCRFFTGFCNATERAQMDSHSFLESANGKIWVNSHHSHETTLWIINGYLMEIALLKVRGASENTIQLREKQFGEYLESALGCENRDSLSSRLKILAQPTIERIKFLSDMTNRGCRTGNDNKNFCKDRQRCTRCGVAYIDFSAETGFIQGAEVPKDITEGCRYDRLSCDPTYDGPARSSGIDLGIELHFAKFSIETQENNPDQIPNACDQQGLGGELGWCYRALPDLNSQLETARQDFNLLTQIRESEAALSAFAKSLGVVINGCSTE